MYGIRVVLRTVENEENTKNLFVFIEGVGQIIRDKARLSLGCGQKYFSAWRVFQVQNGDDDWQKYDGFQLDKVVKDEDGEGHSCDDCQDEREEEEDEYEEEQMVYDIKTGDILEQDLYNLRKYLLLIKNMGRRGIITYG